MDDNRRAGLRQTIGHHGDTAYLVLMGASAAWSIFTSREWPFAQGVSYLLNGATLTVIVFSLIYHTNKLCEICAASFPLNAEEVASRYRREFRFTHRLISGGRSLGRHLLFLASAVLLMAAPALLVRWLFDPSPQIISLISALTFVLPFGYAIWAVGKHSKLQPWCPYCRRGDGGDEEVIKTPDPSPVSQ